MKKLSANYQEILFKLYRYRWLIILSLLWPATAMESSARWMFFGAVSALVVFFIFYKKTFKKYTCVVCRGRGKLPKKSKWTLNSSSTCYSCNGEGTVSSTNYNDLLRHAAQKRTETMSHIKRLNYQVQDLERNMVNNKEILKTSTMKMVSRKIDAYKKQISFRNKVLEYLDTTENNIHKILANIYLLKKVKLADDDLNANHRSQGEEDFKEIFARQGRLELDLSRLEGELYSMEAHLSDNDDTDITEELESEMERLTQQMKNLLTE